MLFDFFHTTVVELEHCTIIEVEVLVLEYFHPLLHPSNYPLITVVYVKAHIFFAFASAKKNNAFYL